jgi:hypothetical protein
LKLSHRSLAAYAPELNPVKPVWPDLNDRWPTSPKHDTIQMTAMVSQDRPRPW